MKNLKNLPKKFCKSPPWNYVTEDFIHWNFELFYPLRHKCHKIKHKRKSYVHTFVKSFIFSKVYCLLDLNQYNAKIHIFIWKWNVYRQNEMQNHLNEKGKERLRLIKSLIYVIVERGASKGKLWKINQSRSNL